MSEPNTHSLPIIVDLHSWINRASSNPKEYRQRQVIGIIMMGIGISSSYEPHLFLKGGILMGLVYDSVRFTQDIDFTIDLTPATFDLERFKKVLNQNMKRSAANLGYPKIICNIHSIRHEPANRELTKCSFPALKVKIGYADRDSLSSMKRLESKNSSDVIDVDISFNEKVYAFDLIQFEDGSLSINAYAFHEVIAEKLRALHQQSQRKQDRFRRQDIYDISFLIDKLDFSDRDKARILEIFLKKCRDRNVTVSPVSLSSDDIRSHAHEQWHTLKYETEILPDFDDCFAKVESLYRSLPWS